MLTEGLAYEVTVELDQHRRDRFEEWFPNVVLDWTTQPEVRSFRVYRGVDHEGLGLRLVFTFASEAAWERFVQRSAHRERMDRLEAVCETVRTALWAPAAVSLKGSERTIVGPAPDGGETWELAEAFDGSAALVESQQ